MKQVPRPTLNTIVFERGDAIAASTRVDIAHEANRSVRDYVMHIIDTAIKYGYDTYGKEVY